MKFSDSSNEIFSLIIRLINLNHFNLDEFSIDIFELLFDLHFRTIMHLIFSTNFSMDTFKKVQKNANKIRFSSLDTVI